MPDDKPWLFLNLLRSAHPGITVGVDKIDFSSHQDVGDVMKPSQNTQTQQ
jgi:hypothetical protein